jgi:hypothetical protein
VGRAEVSLTSTSFQTGGGINEIAAAETALVQQPLADGNRADLTRDGTARAHRRPPPIEPVCHYAFPLLRQAVGSGSISACPFALSSERRQPGRYRTDLVAHFKRFAAGEFAYSKLN